MNVSNPFEFYKGKDVSQYKQLIFEESSPHSISYV